jgi:PAS domain S-box-containing protein
VSVGVLISGVAATVASVVVMRGVMADQERRLLRERANEVAAFLSTSFAPAGSAVRALATAANGGPTVFTATSRAMTSKGVVLTLLLSKDGPGFSVQASAGSGPGVGTSVDAARAALATRALGASDFVSGVLNEGGTTRLALAGRTASPGGVAEYETVLTPSRAIPTSSTAPFHELQGSVYASPVADPAALVFTSQSARRGATGEVGTTFAVGADRWFVSVTARQPLIGSFAEQVPWILLAVGVLATLFAALLVETLVRRRIFALRLVDDRTRTLREREATLGAVFATSPDVIHVLDAAGVATEVSPAVERILGWDAKRFAGRPLTELADPEDAAELASAIGRLLSGESDHSSVRYRAHSREGVPTVLESQAAALKDETGAPVGVVAVTRDITERAALEAAQHDAQLAAEFANRSKSEFLSRMSHELRTPLNAVIGFAQLLEMSELSEDNRDSVAQVLRGGRHLLDLINEVLDISRIETGALALSAEAVSISELVHEAADLIAPLAAERDVRVRVDEPETRSPHVLADRQRLKQILLNLLSNAVKYNRQSGRVEISIRAIGDDHIRVVVSDTGPGITDDKLGRLFTPFDRLGAEQTEVEGTGIGLALSQRLAETMNGGLGVESTPGVGSRFWVELPAAEAPIQRWERERATATPIPAQGDPVNRQRTVVHIEDNLANLKLVERIVGHTAGARLVPALQGRLGIELTRQHHPDLVLLDLHLPDVNGDEVLRILKSDPTTAEIPVVMISADATAGQKERLLEAGAVAYLTKPLDVQQLLSILNDAVDDQVKFAPAGDGA